MVQHGDWATDRTIKEPWFDSTHENFFFLFENIQTVNETHTSFWALCPLDYRDRGAELTINFHLAPRLIL